MIDLATLILFGNMVFGGGIAAIFDNDDLTGGYNKATSGWAGVTLSQPTAIAKADFVSANGGFDASGAITTITLKLYGKTGAEPTSPSDGILIGQSTFTDVNVSRTITITSTDKTTKFDHVWGVVQTGVWAELRELRLFEASATVPYLLSSTHVQTLQKTCNELRPLPWYEENIEQFEVTLEVPLAGSFDLDFVVNVVHQGDLLSPQWLGAVGIGGRMKYKYSQALANLDSQAWEWLPQSATNGINIDNRDPAHYANVSMVSGLPAKVGFYKFTIFMSAHTSGTTLDGVAAILKEGDNGLNGFRVRYTPNGEFINMDELL